MMGITSEPLIDHAKARLTAALNQHAAHVTDASVLLRDVNGPRGGVDKLCRIVVRFRNGLRPVMVERTGADAYAVISEIADRIKQNAGRLLAKRRSSRRLVA
jgi:putative sigma-54 modulation protein